MKKLLLFFTIIVYNNSIEAQCDDTLPVYENFDTNTVGVCWNTIDSDGDGSNWIWRQFSSFYGGGESLESRSWTSGAGDKDPDNWIYSYAIDLTSYSQSDNLAVNWKVRAQDANKAHEYYTIYVATGNQISDFESTSIKQGEFVDEVGGAGVWVSRNLDISSLAGNMVYIAFRHQNISGSQFSVNIDDVLISTEALSLEDVEIDGFKHFYNSKNDLLTISSTQVPMTSINIFNILGQNVFSKTPSTNTRESINLADVNKGIYIAKISFENIEKTIKFIKH